MTDGSNRVAHPSRRALVAGGAAALGANLLPDATNAQSSQGAAAAASPAALVAPERPPGGYNILFILVDQEHFFATWPFPVPGREWIKKNGITFTNHQAASCVCSPARSTIYTGEHIQFTGIFDNLNSLWQPDLSTKIKTIGDRMAELGYYASYQGKWHLSANLDVVAHAIDAPFPKYREIIQSYGFDDFFGVGDISDGGLGGYTYDDTTTAAVVSWLRTKGAALKAAGQPWYLAVNFVNPHDVMYVNSDLPDQNVQSKTSAHAIFRPPHDEIYDATWDEVPLPATRTQPFNTPGRPKGQQIYQEVQDLLVGAWPDEDRRWRLLRNYYFNCIRDCDRQVVTVLDALKTAGMDKNTIVVFNADHGELGGNHQMRGKGNCTYRQQNHVPLMIVHPAYPGGLQCRAVTSQIDLTPTLLALTGASPEKVAKVGAGLKGRDFSRLLAAPGTAAVDALRPAALFNYNMWAYQDYGWSERMLPYTLLKDVPAATKIDELLKIEPNFQNRCAIRSVFDGRYRFSRYFGQTEFNRPTTWEELTSKNDVELYDLDTDPEEIDNLAVDKARYGELVMAMNTKLNTRIDEEVGVDNGSFLPIRNGKWYFPSPSQR
jgi:arylsulfatase A-like enzyme